MSLQHAGTSWQHTLEPQQAEHALWAQQAHHFHIPAGKFKGCAFGVGLWCDCSVLSTHLACFCFPFHKPWPVPLWRLGAKEVFLCCPFLGELYVILVILCHLFSVTSCHLVCVILCHFMSEHQTL